MNFVSRFWVVMILGLIMPLLPVKALSVQPVTYYMSVSNDDLLHATQQAIAPFVLPGDNVTITVLNPKLAQSLTGQWAFESTLRQLWSPRFIMVGHNNGKHIGIPVKVTITRRVWTTTAPVTQGQALSPQLTIVTTQSLQNGVQWLAEHESLDGLVAKLPFSAGQPLDKKKLTTRADVLAKQPVMVDIQTDDINICVQAIASVSGVKGQVIPVTAGKKHYQAEITGPNRARVKL